MAEERVPAVTQIRRVILAALADTGAVLEEEPQKDLKADDRGVVGVYLEASTPDPEWFHGEVRMEAVFILEGAIQGKTAADAAAARDRLSAGIGMALGGLLYGSGLPLDDVTVGEAEGPRLGLPPGQHVCGFSRVVTVVYSAAEAAADYFEH